jgi:hypothetical protein
MPRQRQAGVRGRVVGAGRLLPGGREVDLDALEDCLERETEALSGRLS